MQGRRGGLGAPVPNRRIGLVPHRGALCNLLLPQIALLILLLRLGSLVQLLYRLLGGQEALLVLPRLYRLLWFLWGYVWVLQLGGLLLCHMRLWVLLVLLIPFGGLLKRLGDSWGWLGVLLVLRKALLVLLLCRGSLVLLVLLLYSWRT